MSAADSVTHVFFCKIAIGILNEDNDLLGNFRQRGANGLDSPLIESGKRRIHYQRIRLRREQLVVLVCRVPIISGHLNDAGDKGKDHRNTLRGRGFYIPSILICINRDVILLVNREREAPLIDLFENLVDSVLELSSDFILAPVIELN